MRTWLDRSMESRVDVRLIVDAVMVSLVAAAALLAVAPKLLGWDAPSLERAWPFVGSLLVAVLLLRLLLVQVGGEATIRYSGRQLVRGLVVATLLVVGWFLLIG